MAQRKYNIDFMGVRQWAFAVSAVLMVASIVLLATNASSFQTYVTGLFFESLPPYTVTHELAEVAAFMERA